MDKIISLDKAVSLVKDGMTLMVGGFLCNGGPNRIMDTLSKSSVKELTLICNDAAFEDKGLGLLISQKKVKKIITSYIGSNPTAIDMMNSGELEVEFSPQGTLAERIRAYGAGLGGVLTPTGLGTVVEKREKGSGDNGNQKYILETPLKADIAFIGTSLSDKSGNLYYRGTTRNFNPLMAMSADVVVAETEELAETGSIKPEDVHTPAILIDFIYINQK